MPVRRTCHLFAVPAAVLLAIAAACSDGTSPNRSPPRPHYIAVAAGYEFTCALTSDQRTYCWGNTPLGNDSVPIPLATPEPLVSISASPEVFGANVCGLGATGRAYCWGMMITNDYPYPYPSSPFAMPESLSFLSLSVAQGHVCGITVDSLGICWGSYLAGKRGTGQPIPIGPSGVRPLGEIWLDLVPNPVTGDFKFTRIAAGSWHTCGVLGGGYQGQIACWGDSSLLGNPGAPYTDADSICGLWFVCVPHPVLGPPLTGVSELSAGQSQTCALAASGLRCWGSAAASAVALPPDGVIALSTGRWQACAVLRGGAAWCWADGGSPTVVPFDGDFVTISAGGSHSCAITTGGRVLCWGSNFSGQLGDGSTEPSLVPVEVAGPRS
jgi:hypothetical protein